MLRILLIDLLGAILFSFIIDHIIKEIKSKESK